jgi:hypothetical protein
LNGGSGSGMTATERMEFFMRINRLWAVAATASIAVGTIAGGSALAQRRQPPTGSPLVTDVTQCRSVADSAARLACYDTAVAKLEAATQSDQLVVLDRDKVREARRGLFGFSLPSLGIFGGDEEEVARLEGTIQSLQEDGVGNYRFVLEDGGIWQQTDGRVRPGTKPGSKVVITRGALGSFFMSIDGKAGFPVKRVG